MMNESLPELEMLRTRSETFDVVILNAVWTHFDTRQREAGMRSIC